MVSFSKLSTFFQRLFRFRPMAEIQTPDTFELRSLIWLNDAPLFIDEEQVERFYDAVVRPTHQVGPKKLHISKRNYQQIRGKLGIEGEVSPGGIAAIVKSFLDAKLKAGGELEATGEKEEQESTEVELYPIDTPERKLIQLTAHYLINHEERLFLISDPSDRKWRTQEKISQVPRALVFLDLPGIKNAGESPVIETKLIPMAAEFTNGEVVTIYEDLIKRFKDANDPEDSPPKDDWPAYWRWYADRFDPHKANVAVEQAALDEAVNKRERGRIRWIDYRVPMTKDGEDPLHLHVNAAGKYDIGVFAYNFIKRGHKWGIRIVGTLKSGPDVNVLAIYEK